MYLKSLNIVGFKTFADETEILFDPGFTAVVGPNGCGKSNIVDAIKWVLGEKNAKGLRGEKMDDVIFHGTETRNPAGFSEVTVSFDNSKKTFAIEFPVLKITRRLYPDGNNEYYINDSRAIRKDVEKILMDTGVGKSSYSVMEQGRVDSILNAKPEDRRLIFDEAAGISRFKLERTETIKKLSDTNQNLLRISDVLKSMESDLELKEKQSEKAKEYFSLKTDLTNTDKNLRYLKLRTMKEKLRKAEEELTLTKKKNSEILEKISRESNQLELFEEQRFSLEKKIIDIDKKLSEYLSRKEIHKEKIEKNLSIIKEFEEREKELDSEIQKSKIQSDSNQRELLELEEKLKELHLEVSDYENKLKEFKTKKIELEKAIENNLEEHKKCEEKIRHNEKELSLLRENLKEVTISMIGQIEEKKRIATRISSERNELKNFLIQSMDQIIQEIQDSLNILHSGNIQGLEVSLANLKLVEYNSKLTEFIRIEDSFFSVLFENEGIFSDKEKIDQRIEDIMLENENFSRTKNEVFQEIEKYRIHLEKEKDSIVSVEKLILETKAKISEKLIIQNSIDKKQLEVASKILELEGSKDQLKIKKSHYSKELKELEEKVEESTTELIGISKNLEKEKQDLQGLFNSIQSLKLSSQKDQEDFKNLLPILTDQERKTTGVRVQIESLCEELYNDYSISEMELEEEKSPLKLVQSSEENRLRTLKSEIGLLGSINPLAIDEYRNLKEIYDHNKSQKEDVEESKKKIESILKNLDKESEKVFLENFEIIKANFQETFSTLFNGGRAILELTEPNDPLNSGIEIIAEPPGKHVQNLRLLSGGEKSLTVIALLFGIYMLKPSPFCFLDEIDAALDEINKIRFCQILDKFKNTSQFIVVTHAPPTISRANTVFGVTNEEPGVSKLVSLKLDEAHSFSGKSKLAV
ncbi:MAG: AAA family ATPase [Leptospiraceae bacterium]|nr:AAA family ATPase [Leptospiraceae bacterium]MCK6382238.1 AAA family ATPase [Leptospiraceae bacterium]NUM40590.1 AAA family ATPase [Leptospiraceae bacterium]